jgi:PKD repeat protein
MSVAFAYNVPQDSSRVKYFYVFGPEGDVKSGAEDHELTLFIDVPQEEIADVVIGIYDPNTGGMRDWRSSQANIWNTTTEFTVHGAKLLDKEEFGEEGYDRRYFQFGPYSKTQGKKTNGFYRFKLEVKATAGDDANLFKVKISPDSAQSFSQNITFRLLPNEGDMMYFYPEVPAGIKQLTVENYDLDRDGGSSELYDKSTKTKYSINDSMSGEWRHTLIPITTTKAGRLEYRITKARQRHAHAGLRIKDDKGRLIPIYFRKGEPVVVAVPEEKPTEVICGKFTFDARDSYDPDNQELSFKWDFGDGNTSDKVFVTHVYEKGGVYNVRLTVTDNSGLQCDTAVVSKTVRVNTPPKAMFVAPDLVCVNGSVNFDASDTTDDTPGQLTYKWDFGDGTVAEGQQIAKLYKKGGTYQVKLMVDDNEETACSTDSTLKAIKVNTPPVANAGDDVDLCLGAGQDYSITFDGSGSQDDDRDELTYRWDFGDGTTGFGKKVTHLYSRGGNYTARLIVNDDVGSTCSVDIDSVSVKLNKAPIADAGDDIVSCAGRAILFDGTSSFGEEGEKIGYTWDFGDGIQEKGVKTSHVYRKGGTYEAILTVDDGRGTKCSVSTDTALIKINSGPTAALSKSDTGCVGDNISLDASASRDPDDDALTYTWNFGDGVIREGGAAATHSYDKGGVYRVQVTVDDRQGTICSKDSATGIIKINTPPIADAGPNLVCCVGTLNSFDGTFSTDADGDTLSYMWDFGDGASGKGAKTTHVYTKPGVYTVALKVDDNSKTDCSSSQDSFTATVNEKPVPVMKVK